MEHSSVKIIKLASTLFLSIPGVSWALRLYWNKILTIIFTNQLSRERILLLALSKEKGIEEENDLEVVSASMALLLLLKHQAEVSYNFSEMKSITAVVEKTMTKYNLDDESVQKLVSDFQTQIDNHGKRLQINFPTTTFPIVMDHLLRWVILWIFFPDSQTLFWVLQFIGLPAVVLLYSWLRTRSAKTYNSQILEPYGGISGMKVVPQRSAFQITLLAFFIIIGIAVTISILEVGDAGPVAFISFLGYLVYYGIYLKHFSVKRISEKALALQFEKIPRFGQKLSPDENDVVIVHQISQLKSITGRLEAYILESALFGALAFSGFLQLMAEGLVSFQELEAFANHAFSLFSGFVSLNWDQMATAGAQLTTKSDLFALISLETLVCSMLFLVVIASRLRYSDISDRVTHSLDLSQSFNKKEEVLLSKGEPTANEIARMKDYNNKIFKQIQETEAGMMEMAPVTTFMRFFRNAGIFTFIVILVSSALFISTFMSWLFALLGLATVIYFNRKHLIIISDRFVLRVRWVFVRSGFMLLVGSILIFILVFLLRTLIGWHNTDLLIQIGFVLLGAYWFIWIVLVPHYDKFFEEDYNIEMENSSGWMTTRIFWGAAAFLFVQGFSMKLLDFPGATAVILLGGCTMMVTFVLIGARLARPKWVGTIAGIALSTLIVGIMFKLLHFPGAAALTSSGTILIAALSLLQGWISRPRWAGLLIGISFSLGIIGITFKMLHLPGAGVFLLIGTISFLIALIVSRIKPLHKKIFHSMFSTNAVVVILVAFSLIGGPGFKIEQAYDNFTLSPEILSKINSPQGTANNFIEQIELVNHPDQFSMDLSKYMDEVDWYINYSRDLPITDDSKTFIRYNLNLSLYILRNFDDQSAYEWGYKLARQANLLGEKAGYPDWAGFWNRDRRESEPYWLSVLEPIFLQKLGRNEETKKAIKHILEYEQLESGEMEQEIKRFFPDYSE